jgi:L-alanine-DL-glutamate epimerase-like enolase superfamily enzyme
MSTTLKIRRVSARVYRYPLETPVTTSFGSMRDRPAVFTEVEDADGTIGYGEIWCNFPACGAEHRARLLASVMAPLLCGADFAHPTQPYALLTGKTAVLAIQSGEQGPMAQVIAGIDTAVWDLAARKAGQPLWRFLGGASPAIKVYASGLNPDHPERLAEARQADGHTAFKLKIGFGLDRDLANLTILRQTLGADAKLMVDANQAWDLETACRIAPRLGTFDLGWLEEPIRADRPWSDWKALAAASPVPLAAGENIAGEADFEAALATNILRVVQPDMAKWGGYTGCLPIARRIRYIAMREANWRRPRFG